ncbi:MAG: DUF3090 family protein [Nocardioides sp.]
MGVVHRFDRPDRFVAGTVGAPGERVFFLQVREGPRVITVALEKQQVTVLGERIDELLDQVIADGLSTEAAMAPLGSEDTAGLDIPIEEEFRVGTITLAWDGTEDQVVVELIGVEADDEDPDELVVIQLQPAQARAFSRRAALVVEAGRPSCPFCGNAIDPGGHLCVRANGYRRNR